MRLHVLSPGPLATVQDLGRPHLPHLGVPTSGGMDRFALQAANLLVGNGPSAAAMEITGGGALVEIDEVGVLAVTGADFGQTLNGLDIPGWASVLAPAGSTLALGGRSQAWGARAYLAVAGGVDAPMVLGARSTYLPGGFGGIDGRPIRAGDVLPIGRRAPGFDAARLAGSVWPATARPMYRPSAVARVLPGPHLDCLGEAALARLCAEPWRVSLNSNRMGYRLEGGRVPHIRPCSLPSLGVFPGVVQVPPDGAPIVLMADAQTTGGYPIAAVVIQADLPLLAQALPGDTVRFQPCVEDEALDALRVQQAWLAWRPDEGFEGCLSALAGHLGSTELESGQKAPNTA